MNHSLDELLHAVPLALANSQPKTSDCSYQEAPIALNQRYCTRQVQSSLQPPETSGWESDYLYLNTSKTSEHSLVATGLNQPENPSTSLKFIAV